MKTMKEDFAHGDDDNDKPRKEKRTSGNASSRAGVPVGSSGFEKLGISRIVLAGIRRRGFRQPTPVQRKTIPQALAGHDCVVMARTGSGKTAAFVIPVIEKLLQLESATLENGIGASPLAHTKMMIRACLLSPTRELALQTFKVVKDLAHFTNLKNSIVLLVGGDSMEAQFESLFARRDKTTNNNDKIVVATPGRLLHLLSEINNKIFEGNSTFNR